MTGDSNLNSNAARNLLGSGRLQAQMRLDLNEAFARHIQEKIDSAVVDKVFDDFGKNPLNTIDQLIDMLADALDAGLKESFVDRPDYSFLFFILLIVALTIPFWMDYFNFCRVAEAIRSSVF